MCAQGCGIAAASFWRLRRSMDTSSHVFKLRIWTFTLGGKTQTKNTETPQQICTYTNDIEKQTVVRDVKQKAGNGVKAPVLEVNASGLAMAVKIFMFGLVHQWPSRLGVHTIHFEKFIMGEADLIYLISKTKQQGAREKEHASLSLQLNFF